MRLPLTKLHRAFPEFDPFTDEQCLWYIARAKRKHRLLNASVVAGLITAGFTAWGCCGLPIVAWVDQGVTGNQVSPGLVMVAFAAPAILAGVLALLARDRWLRWLIRKVLARAVCPSCEYSLLGLRVENGRVVCPECGAPHTLTTMGLTPDDLIAEVATP